MFGNIGKIMSIITEKGAVKKLAAENAPAIIGALVQMMYQRLNLQPTEGVQNAVMLLPVVLADTSQKIVVILVEFENGEVVSKGQCELDELIALLPDNVMDLMK
jgi:hypothetical protein